MQYSDKTDENNPRPKALEVRPDGIPDEIKRLDRWVNWKYKFVVGSAGVGRWTKSPICSRTLGYAKSTDATTWGSFDYALSRLRQSAQGEIDVPLAGVGFMLGDGWAGLDCDACIAADGSPKPKVQHLLDHLDTYTEASPSGKGVKMLFRGDIGRGRKDDLSGIEIYSNARFFTVTGHKLPNAPATVNERQEKAAKFVEEFFGDDDQDEPADHSGFIPPPVTDQRIRQAIQRAKWDRPNSESVRSLFAGEWQGAYESQSGADLALVGHLAYELGPDAQAIDQAFRCSGLMRRKWERPDYRKRTIACALRSLKRWHQDNQTEPDSSLEPTSLMYDDLFLDTAAFFAQGDKQRQDYIINPLLPAGGLNIISGDSYAGKTVFLFWLFGLLMRGERVLGFETKPTEVLYINGDQNPVKRLGRLLQANVSRESPTPGFHYLTQPVETLTADHLDLLCKCIWAKRGKDTRLLVVGDTFRPLVFMDAKTGDDLDSVAMTKKIKPFKSLVSRYEESGKLTLLFGYHNARTTGKYYGSGAFMNMCTSYWNYKRDEGSKVATIEHQDRDNDNSTLSVKYEDGQFSLVGEPVCLEDAVEQILNLTDPLLSMTKAENALKNCKQAVVRIAWNHLVDHGVIVQAASEGRDARFKTKSADWPKAYARMRNALKWG